MPEMPDGTWRFRTKWRSHAYWGITGVLWAVLRLGGLLLFLCLALIGIAGMVAFALAIGGILVVLLASAAVVWAVVFIGSLVYHAALARSTRTHAREDDNVVPIEHAPRRRFRG